MDDFIYILGLFKHRKSLQCICILAGIKAFDQFIKKTKLIL
jgi:hypothetical protein